MKITKQKTTKSRELRVICLRGKRFAQISLKPGRSGPVARTWQGQVMPAALVENIFRRDIAAVCTCHQLCCSGAAIMWTGDALRTGCPLLSLAVSSASFPGSSSVQGTGEKNLGGPPIPCYCLISMGRNFVQPNDWGSPEIWDKQFIWVYDNNAVIANFPSEKALLLSSHSDICQQGLGGESESKCLLVHTCVWELLLWPPLGRIWNLLKLL